MYISLFNKSNYTMLSSLLKIDDIVNFAKNNNYWFRSNFR